MGTTLSTLPKIIQMPATNRTFGGFSNATGGELYQKALKNYNDQLSLLTGLQQKSDAIKLKLDNLDAYHASFMGSGFAAQVNEILGKSGYGDLAYGSRWNSSVSKNYIPNEDLRQRYYETESLTANNWEYIYNNGLVTAEPPYVAAQAKIVKHWDNKILDARKNLDKDYVNAERQITTKESHVSRAKTELDNAIKAEQIASDQRIRENLTNPEYLKAQAEAAAKKRTTYAVVVIVGLAVVVGGAALIFKK